MATTVHLTTGLAVAALLATALGAPVAAAAGDASSTHAYLAADYAILHTTVGSWSRVESSIGRLDSQLAAECPHVGAGSPQSEEEQKLSLEVAGALWATAYRTNATAIHTFVRKVAHLTWSNPAVTRAARRLTRALSEMASLTLPPLCSDVRAWAASGFGTVPADVAAFAKHVEAVEIDQIPRRLLAPSLAVGDRPLAAADARLNRRFEELEFVHGQDQWNRLLEVLSLNQ
ncbi:MAG TPA: hypothetical protein VHU13_09980 [Solirubrobacteraceae bacterium]|jgi:hypothetical protein|nr:hypothetical protein [Solirubrobacteraceae bacterium]